ncbi:hypothetical protein JJB07_07695 [Tumebacillus sp. ITR2]|uniref:Uncharacterized protein n=1 Tax=Tumebacillus amylolyticus TaxID=2801339 RepID=A0ABS1J8E6_9BACL|nr:hypothetical protein [Tumebacillus amylolyticus]MBL0386529.1 hypothetical protein [Tumebacillus amylolyticus]
MDDQFLDLLAKSIFKNVKRRRLTEDEKQRLRTVADEIQAHLNAMNQGTSDGAKEQSGKKQDGTKRRPRLTWRRDN